MVGGPADKLLEAVGHCRMEMVYFTREPVDIFSGEVIPIQRHKYRYDHYDGEFLVYKYVGVDE